MFNNNRHHHHLYSVRHRPSGNNNTVSSNGHPHPNNLPRIHLAVVVGEAGDQCPLGSNSCHYVQP